MANQQNPNQNQNPSMKDKERLQKEKDDAARNAGRGNDTTRTTRQPGR